MILKYYTLFKFEALVNGMSRHMEGVGHVSPLRLVPNMPPLQPPKAVLTFLDTAKNEHIPRKYAKTILSMKIALTAILNASILAMHRAINQLKTQPEFIAIDGNKFKPYNKVPYECVVKGDSKYLHIAAASILAKTYRDDFMEKLHKELPNYHWQKNKGYPTAEHREAIKKYGPTKFHRKSFRLLPEQLKLF